MTARLGSARLVLQVVPLPVAGFWPWVGFASNLGTSAAPLPGFWYVEANLGRLLLTVTAAARH